MPLLSIETNYPFDPENDLRSLLIAEASLLCTTMLGKPESYVMVTLRPTPHMSFGGSQAPSAYMELKSLGLAEDQTSHYSEQLCSLITRHLGIPADRVYIEFTSGPRHLWGWNNGTF